MEQTHIALWETSSRKWTLSPERTKSPEITNRRTAIAKWRSLRDDELDAVTGGVGKTIAAKAKIIDGQFRT
jgi:hypothetical protein